MVSRRAIPFLAVLCLPVLASGYSGVADVTLSWGVNGTAISWSSADANNLAVVGNSSRFTAQAGSSGLSYFNADFAAASNYGSGTGDDCLTLLSGYSTIELRKYGCRQRDTANVNNPVFHRSPVVDAGPPAAAIGTLNFTDTTLTGTLTVVATTDEPTGGDESSAGNGASGFNLRTLDTSPFGNAWYGVSTGATLTVDLTGDFSAAGWEIVGGTVRLSDPAFQCQQGAIGGVAPEYVLCQLTAVPGGFSGDGSHLSFGVDVNGGLPGATMSEIQIRDAGGTVVASLSGVLATLTVGAGGALTTDFGEFRSGVGTSTGGCLGQIRWDGAKITCGTLTAGGLQITGTATPVDTEPDPFVFTSATDVGLSTVTTSNAVTIAGIAAPARITVAGGQYSIGCTATFTTAASNIPLGSTVCVRHTSSPSPATDTVTTLTIGGRAGTYTSTTIPPDITPQPFTFADQVDVTAATLIVSAPVTISGINGASPVSVSGGEYSLGCGGVFTAVSGTVSPGQSVCVRHTSAVAPVTATDTVLTVGGVSDTFTSTTSVAPPDTTPDAFLFVDQSGVALATQVISAPIVIAGINTAATVTVSGGDYSVGCTGVFIATPGSVSDGESVCVRHTSAATNSTVTNTTLTVGGVSDTFTTTTVAPLPDTTPDAFAFADQAGVAVATMVVSAPVVITGVNAAAPVTVTGGDYSIGCTGTFTSASASMTGNQSVCVRHTSALTNSTQTITTLTVGGVSGTFLSTTVAIGQDGTPDAFTFVDAANVSLSSSVTSAPVTIAGINVPVTVSITGGAYSVGCSSTYVTAPGSVSGNQTICVRHTSAATNGAQMSTTLTVGGVSDSFVSTTVAASGSGSSGGGALDPWTLGILASLPVWYRRGRRSPGTGSPV